MCVHTLLMNNVGFSNVRSLGGAIFDLEEHDILKEMRQIEMTKAAPKKSFSKARDDIEMK